MERGKKTYSPFVYWVKNFIDKHDLLKNKSVTPIALVSGGADSLALLHVILTLNIKIIPLYFHHHTRTSEEHEADLAAIKKVLKRHQKPESDLVIVHLKGMNLANKNFEYEARVHRKKYLTHNYPENLILSAHHLDDSFEWWLRGRLTQSRSEIPLGIPLKAGNYVRPFMCVSKKHILNFLAREKISFHEDSSNTNEKFERNFLRKNITNHFAKKYPKYLKHYVVRQNQLAKRLVQEKKEIKKLAENLWYFSLEKKHTLEDLHKILISKSSVERGNIHKALTRAFDDKMNFNEIRGPMSFSGGLHLWQWHHHFFLWKNPIRPNGNLDILDQYLQQNIAHIHFSDGKDHYPLDIMGLEIIKSTKFHSKYFKEILAFKKWTPIFYQGLLKRKLKLVIRTTNV